MRILTVTTLYPNAAQPTHGIFVENRLRHLAASGEVALSVLAPVPWFPFPGRAFGRYGAFARAPGRELRHGIPVDHPRYPVIPKLGMGAAPYLLHRSLRRFVARLPDRGRGYDLIDAHFFYPDGIAAAWLAADMGRPVVITARGTDLNDYVPRHPAIRRMIRDACDRAAGLITVCQALKNVLVELGVPEERVTVLRNGVDLVQFSPGDRDSARRKHGVDGPTVLSVGHLIPRKGHDIAIEAVARLPGVTLLIAGEGPERPRLERLARRIGVTERVRLLGRLPQTALPDLYRAADALVLASDREGWANVLLEAMACGTPVVASAIWGTPEVVADPAAGLLVPERNAEQFAAALAQLLAAPPARDETRRYAEQFSWDETTAGQLRLFRGVLESRKSGEGGD